MNMIDIRLVFDNPAWKPQWIRVIRPTRKLAKSRLALYKKQARQDNATVHYAIFDRKGMLEDSKGDTGGDGFRNDWSYDVSYYH